MKINKYFSSFRSLSCHYVEKFQKNLLYKLKTQVLKKNSCITQAHFDVLCMLISAKRRLGLPSNYWRLVSAQRRLMASGGSLPSQAPMNDLLSSDKELLDLEKNSLTTWARTRILRHAVSLPRD